MSQVEAIYQDGVFKPLGAVELQPNQRVLLQVEPVAAGSLQQWLREVADLHERFVAKRGYLPDSTAEIAEDRKR